MQIKEVRVAQVETREGKKWQYTIIAKEGSIRVTGQGQGDTSTEAREAALQIVTDKAAEARAALDELYFSQSEQR